MNNLLLHSLEVIILFYTAFSVQSLIESIIENCAETRPVSYYRNVFHSPTYTYTISYLHNKM